MNNAISFSVNNSAKQELNVRRSKWDYDWVSYYLTYYLLTLSRGWGKFAQPFLDFDFHPEGKIIHSLLSWLLILFYQATFLKKWTKENFGFIFFCNFRLRRLEFSLYIHCSISNTAKTGLHEKLRKKTEMVFSWNFFY